VAENKIKKKDGDLSIPLRRTQDILKYLGENRRAGQVIVGFFHGNGKHAGKQPRQAPETKMWT
jgi:phosphopantothenoylcysteine synthetase/decarboxylase